MKPETLSYTPDSAAVTEAVTVQLAPAASVPPAKASEVGAVRVSVDDSSEKLGKKIRDGKTQKVPYLIVVGAAEAENGTITVESYHEGKLAEISSLDQLAHRLRDEISQKVAKRKA